VLLVDINAAGLAETETLLDKAGARAGVHVADLAESSACEGAVAAAVERFGKLDALCNVAGVIFFTHAAEMTDAQWNKTLALNLSAPFFLIRAALPHLIAAEGAVVNVASAAAFVGEAYLAAYAASKAALVGLTRSLAMEFMHAPIRINGIAPGGMATPMSAQVTVPEGIDATLIQRYAGMRGTVDVEDVADMVCFLASPAARSYHGAVISIDGGITAG
jgi:NAD(P)-dependent dehydrogenase (short-subunit alcohol dehydrogenase family)